MTYHSGNPIPVHTPPKTLVVFVETKGGGAHHKTSGWNFCIASQWLLKDVFGLLSSLELHKMIYYYIRFCSPGIESISVCRLLACAATYHIQIVK
jgi:hypothetical protein